MPAPMARARNRHCLIERPAYLMTGLGAVSRASHHLCTSDSSNFIFSPRAMRSPIFSSMGMRAQRSERMMLLAFSSIFTGTKAQRGQVAIAPIFPAPHLRQIAWVIRPLGGLHTAPIPVIRGVAPLRSIGKERGGLGGIDD